MIFVDTGAWYASVVPSDPNHAAAVQWLNANVEPLLTTDFVIDETLTLLKARGHLRRALALGTQWFVGNRSILHHLTPAQVEAAWQIFQRFTDKDWSFTDCTSKVVMEQLALLTAFAFDQHFRQFGGVVVVP
jgi:hypothetical protein